MANLRVCVVGLGYVGLPTAALIADTGVAVIGVDIDQELLRELEAGRTRLSEHGLRELVSRVTKRGKLAGSDVPLPSEVFVIAVPTPVAGRGHKRADLSAVTAAVEAVGRVLAKGNLVVVESTCPPRTTLDQVVPALARTSALEPGRDFMVAYCPERVLPGRILDELASNPRVVGGIDARSAAAARSFYERFVKGPITETDATTAELVKLMENTFRDVNIALANEFALVAEQLGVDAWEAIRIANRHPRVNMLRPGPGVGGHCIAVDPWFVIGAAPAFTPLISASRAVNDAMPLHVVDLVETALGGLNGMVITALGLTYKADVDDTRESPSLEVISALTRAGAEVRVHDAMLGPAKSVEDLAIGSDALLLLVDHSAYASLEPAALRSKMRRGVLVDARNFLPHARWAAEGFDVVCLGVARSSRTFLGRPPVAAQESQLRAL